MSAASPHPLQQSAAFAADALTDVIESGSECWATIRNVRRAQNLSVRGAEFRGSESRDPYTLVDAGQVTQGIARLADSHFKINSRLTPLDLDGSRRKRRRQH